MHRLVCLLAMSAVLTADPVLADGAQHPLLTGFTSAGSSAQRELEARFDSHLDAADLRRWLERMSKEPNHVGSAHGKANAEFMLRQFREWGWDARIDTYSLLFPTPIEQTLELVAPRRFTATLREPMSMRGSTTARKGILPAYAAYGADGDVTAELIYVNYGMAEDYETLKREGVSVKGKIVLVRYGGGWRGLKPKLAQQHGAVGCIIYSDPADDLYGDRKSVV